MNNITYFCADCENEKRDFDEEIDCRYCSAYICGSCVDEKGDRVCEECRKLNMHTYFFYYEYNDANDGFRSKTSNMATDTEIELSGLSAKSLIVGINSVQDSIERDHPNRKNPIIKNFIRIK